MLSIVKYVELPISVFLDAEFVGTHEPKYYRYFSEYIVHFCIDSSHIYLDLDHAILLHDQSFCALKQQHSHQTVCPVNLSKNYAVQKSYCVEPNFDHQN